MQSVFVWTLDSVVLVCFLVVMGVLFSGALCMILVDRFKLWVKKLFTKQEDKQ